MRILQLCHKPPYPPREGGAIAMYNLAMGLMDLGHEVHILAMNTYKQYCDPASVPADFQARTQYGLVDVDIRVKAGPAFLNLFGNQSYNLSRFDAPQFRAALRERLAAQSYDLVVVESLYASAYLDDIRKMGRCPVVLRSHNVEHHIWQNLARHARGPLRRGYLRLLARRLRHFELLRMQEVDLVAAISLDDIAAFRAAGIETPMFHLPFGIDFGSPEFSAHALPEAVDCACFHVGSMEWLPHQEAFAWFLREVWPRVHAAVPTLPLHLAGSNMPAWISDGRFPNVHVTAGQVDGKAYMDGKAIMVVPSFSGSGIRIKVIEGMAKGKVVLTTRNGALGITAQHGLELLIAETAAEWVQLLRRLGQEPEWLHAIGRNARAFAERRHDHRTAAQALVRQVGTL